LALDKTELNMLLGGSLETLTIIGLLEDTPVTWASDDWRVARVSNGKVISVCEGRANITANVGGTILTCVVNVYTEDLLITNDIFEMDTDGNPILTQWNAIYKFGDKFYRYGMRNGNGVSYYNSLRQGTGVLGGSGWAIVCYSSDNMVDWKYEGVMAQNGMGGFSSSYARLGVLYNEKNDNYILTGDTGGVRFATAPTPTGPWTHIRTQTNINRLGPDTTFAANSADLTAFWDYTTGKGYVAFVCAGVTEPGFSGQNAWETLPERDKAYIGVLNEDFTAIEYVYELYDAQKDTYYNLLREAGREANSMFVYDGWYYYVASGLRGWNSGPTFYMSGARSPEDKTYTNEVGLPNSMLPMRGSVHNFTHTTQAMGFITIDSPESAQAPVGQMVLEWGDRFGNNAGNGFGFTQWAPISFLDPTTAPPLTAADLPKIPDPQAYSRGEFFNPNNPWKDMESFYPFLPEGYPYTDANGNPEWKRPEWPIPYYNNYTQFYYDVANGSWDVGPNNNFITNSYFENDRLAGGLANQTVGDVFPNTFPVIQTYVNVPTAWEADHIAGQVAQINYGGNRTSTATLGIRNYQLIAPGSTGNGQNWYSAWAGNYAWYHGYTKRNTGTDPYITKTYQDVEVPDGIYNYYGWVRSSGGQNEAYIYVGDHKADFNMPLNAWTLITIEDVEIKGGNVQIGFYSDAQADQWAFFDDFVLVAKNFSKDDVQGLVDDALDLNKNDFTTASWEKLMAAVINALDVIDNGNARQTSINSAYYRLLKAIKGLAPTVLVKAVPNAWVDKLNGNKNDLYITVTETYCNGFTVAFSAVFKIDNNAEGTYQVGPYRVFVNTKGNIQIREIFIRS